MSIYINIFYNIYVHHKVQENLLLYFALTALTGRNLWPDVPPLLHLSSSALLPSLSHCQPSRAPSPLHYSPTSSPPGPRCGLPAAFMCEVRARWHAGSVCGQAVFTSVWPRSLEPGAALDVSQRTVAAAGGERPLGKPAELQSRSRPFA